MKNIYDYKVIEKKWQDRWEENNTYCADDNFKKPKFYVLVEFPYPSAQGLHVGHPRSYVAMDIVARKRRMQGYNVLFPIGWDAFGLPAENYAMKNKVHPKGITTQNINNFRRQLKSIGLSFDWKREVNTTDPKYYRWTQWIFSKLFEKGLAVKRPTLVNWCTSCKCVLSNEEVIEGKCERCSAGVVQRKKSQWVLKITEYAQRLIDDLDLVDYPERVKIQQKNWIGKSEGALINFKLKINGKNTEKILKVFTTRPDTVFGVTYVILSPEHELVDYCLKHIENRNEVELYREQTSKKSEFERTQLKEKNGVELIGAKVLNPFNEEEIPLFISDYVLADYGSGAVMAVPAHDTRDWEFAKKYNLPIREVVSGGDPETEAYTKDGKIVNSDFINGLDSDKAKIEIIKEIEAKKIGERKVNYKLRDWIFSRQRYWGEPIPIIECEDCGFVLDKNLPLVLPDIENYEPTQGGESPLDRIDWCDTHCPQCGRKAKRETDTMPQWAGSSWYFLRYIDPFNANELASKKVVDYWLPIDWYNGGMEHTTLHLLYSRFWHKFLYDIGVVPCPEPYKKRTSHGMILGENGEKMSKSRGNVVNPDKIIEHYGADTTRLYEMFMGDFEQVAFWNFNSIKGCYRFLEKVWSLQDLVIKGKEIRREMLNVFHKTIKKVGEDIENLKFNTAISALMILVNEIKSTGSITEFEFDIFTILIFPFVPHISEELREIAGLNEASKQPWLIYDPEYVKTSTVEIVVQVNGKLKCTVSVNSESSEEEITNLVLKNEIVARTINRKDIKNKIYVPNRLINFVI
ncbi:MAG: leucine--tRNA ligase [Candidatus Improbicoccus pseudotrichonymphae]|uniref:Leucine--tRNA ligase n=1 Tax=Candidatus Improbicoccus pseudotrichonymphae TaxID=3033792 RepID=A0AA48I146_9FIRM|nr:MAG: leucine--tRNA ligase [Candidatus Improbicoccus pseudotrichonymphae]